MAQAGPPATTTSHRLQRSAHNKPRYAVPLRKNTLCTCGGVYNLYMPNFVPIATEFSYLSAPLASVAELEKWICLR